MQNQNKEKIIKIVELIEKRNKIHSKREKEIEIIINKFYEITHADSNFKEHFQQMVKENKFPSIDYDSNLQPRLNWASNSMNHNGCQIMDKTFRIDGKSALKVSQKTFNEKIKSMNEFLDNFIDKINMKKIALWDELLDRIHNKIKEELEIISSEN